MDNHVSIWKIKVMSDEIGARLVREKILFQITDVRPYVGSLWLGYI